MTWRTPFLHRMFFSLKLTPRMSLSVMATRLELSIRRVSVPVERGERQRWFFTKFFSTAESPLAVCTRARRESLLNVPLTGAMTVSD